MLSAPHGPSVRRFTAGTVIYRRQVVHSKSASHHVDDFRGYLVRLIEYSLNLSPKKAHIGAPEVQFLGHLVTPSGLRPDPKKIEAMLKVRDCARPAFRRPLINSLCCQKTNKEIEFCPA